MNLSALDKVRLGRQLNGLLNDVSAAAGLQKITIGRQINAVLLQLGYGAGQATVTEPESNAEKVIDISAVPAEEGNSKPEIVSAFLNGDYVNQGSEEFTKTLTKLEPFLDVFLTMDDVVSGSSDWLRENYPEAA